MFYGEEGDSTDNFVNVYTSQSNKHIESFNTINKYDKITHRKPNISYAELIAESLERSETHMLTLKEIYAYISSNYPYFDMNKTGWQNSIRHNLSLNRAFYKVPRGMGNPGKGSYWKINYEFYTQKQGYKTKRISSRLCNRSTEEYPRSQGFLENIGVTEMVPKSNVTSIFSGNLNSLYDNVDNIEHTVDTRNPSHIFTFKK